MIGIYSSTSDLLTIILGTVAIRHVQDIPLVGSSDDLAIRHVLWTYGITATIVR